MDFFLKRCINIAIVIFGETMMVSAQVDLSKFEVGVNVSTYLYQGDLTPSSAGSFKTPGFGLMIFANRLVTPSFSLRTNFAFGSLKGDDGKFSDPAWRKQRNFSFKTPVFEISEMLLWNVLGKNSERGFKGFSPYLFGGIGVSLLHITRDLSRYNAEYFASEPHVQEGLNMDLATTLPKAIPIFPLGVGIRYSLNPRISLQAESSYRLTATDYLDGFSKSANAGRKDQYASHSVGIIYKFKGRNAMDCPTAPK